MDDPTRPSTQLRLERLLSASLMLATEVSVERVLQKVVDIAVDLIGARYAALGVVSADGRTLEKFVTTGMTSDQRHAIGHEPRGHGVLGLVIREATVVRLPDLTRHPDSFGFPPNHPIMHSFLGVPIIGRRGVFGNLYLTEKLGGGLFTEDDEYIALLLAAQAAASVENARLHGDSARLLAEVQQLQRTRERFFAMVNHELRNAIAGVYGWAEMLVRRKEPGEVPRHGLYRWHVFDPIRFKADLRATIQALGWWPGGKFQPLTDDIASVAYWYQAEPHAAFPAMPLVHERYSR